MGVINLDKREKVINALLACYSADEDIKWCQAREKGLCNYNVAHCRMALFKDAAELLKAQEPLTIEPKRIDLADETKAELDEMDAVDALGNIADICIDWDGYRTADGLGGLINEVWAYARYCADRLAKSQAPRLMTYDELCKVSRTDGIVYVERRTKTYYNEMAFVAVEKVYGDTVTFSGQKSIFGHSKKDYGKEWRCWTSRPSDEQMKAVKWDE